MEAGEGERERGGVRETHRGSRKLHNKGDLISPL